MHTKTERTFNEIACWCLIAFAVIFIILLCTGCGQRYCQNRFPPQIIQYDSIIRDTIERVRDSIIKIPPDYAYLKAWIECDRNGKLMLKKIEDYEAGSKVKPKILIRNNYVELECVVDTASIALHWIETHTKAVDSNERVEIVEVNRLTSWQSFQIWLGRILGGLVLLYLALIILKKQFKLF